MPRQRLDTSGHKELLGGSLDNRLNNGFDFDLEEVFSLDNTESHSIKHKRKTTKKESSLDSENENDFVIDSGLFRDKEDEEDWSPSAPPLRDAYGREIPASLDSSLSIIEISREPSIAGRFQLSSASSYDSQVSNLPKHSRHRSYSSDGPSSGRSLLPRDSRRSSAGSILSTTSHHSPRKVGGTANCLTPGLKSNRMSKRRLTKS